MGVREILIQSATTLLNEYKRFWLLSALTDRSFEEGKRNRHFEESVQSFETVGLESELASQLRQGINGNLQAIIEGMGIHDGKVIRRQSRVPDLAFVIKCVEAFVEVKMIYDLTFDSYFASVADDGRKLRQLASPGRQLFQLVFFIQLPTFNYPDGRWYGNKDSKSRRDWITYPGIGSQFDRLMAEMKHPPTWPGISPLVQPLESSGLKIGNQFLQRWFEHIFDSRDEGWVFDPNRQLVDAAVGVAMWELVSN